MNSRMRSCTCGSTEDAPARTAVPSATGSIWVSMRAIPGLVFIRPGDAWETTQDDLYTGAVYGICASGGKVMLRSEW